MHISSENRNGGNNGLFSEQKKPPWFGRMSEVRQWLEEQEENRLQSKHEMGF